MRAAWNVAREPGAGPGDLSDLVPSDGLHPLPAAVRRRLLRPQWGGALVRRRAGARLRLPPTLGIPPGPRCRARDSSTASTGRGLRASGRRPVRVDRADRHLVLRAARSPRWSASCASRPLTVYLTFDPESLPSYGDDVVAVLIGDEWARVPAYLGARPGRLPQPLRAAQPRLPARSPGRRRRRFAALLPAGARGAAGAPGRLRRPRAEASAARGTGAGRPPDRAPDRHLQPARPAARALRASAARTCSSPAASSTRPAAARGSKARVMPKGLSREAMLRNVERLRARPDVSVDLRITEGFQAIGRSRRRRLLARLDGLAPGARPARRHDRDPPLLPGAQVRLHRRHRRGPADLVLRAGARSCGCATGTSWRTSSCRCCATPSGSSAAPRIASLVGVRLLRGGRRAPDGAELNALRLTMPRRRSPRAARTTRDHAKRRSISARLRSPIARRSCGSASSSRSAPASAALSPGGTLRPPSSGHEVLQAARRGRDNRPGARHRLERRHPVRLAVRRQAVEVARLHRRHHQVALDLAEQLDPGERRRVARPGGARSRLGPAAGDAQARLGQLAARSARTRRAARGSPCAPRGWPGTGRPAALGGGRAPTPARRCRAAARARARRAPALTFSLAASGRQQHRVGAPLLERRARPASHARAAALTSASAPAPVGAQSGTYGPSTSGGFASASARLTPTSTGLSWWTRSKARSAARRR